MINKLINPLVRLHPNQTPIIICSRFISTRRATERLLCDSVRFAWCPVILRTVNHQYNTSRAASLRSPERHGDLFQLGLVLRLAVLRRLHLVLLHLVDHLAVLRMEHTGRASGPVNTGPGAAGAPFPGYRNTLGHVGGHKSQKVLGLS